MGGNTYGQPDRKKSVFWRLALHYWWKDLLERLKTYLPRQDRRRAGHWLWTMPAQKKQIFRISCEQGQPEILALSLFKVSTWFSPSDVFSSSWERGDFPHFMLRPTRDLLLSLSISWDAHRVTKRQWKKLNSSRFLERWLGYITWGLLFLEYLSKTRPI